MSFLVDNFYIVRYNGNIIEIRGQVMNYIAIIGDIVNSKQTSNRSSIQERLKQQLNRINHSFAQDFASPFTPLQREMNFKPYASLTLIFF